MHSKSLSMRAFSRPLPRWLPLLAVVSTLSVQPLTVLAQGTAFTYQGQLSADGKPANGNYDFKFSVYDAPSGGKLVGGPMTNAAVGINNGLFATALDFGGGVFDGRALWLNIEVRTNLGGTFSPLDPRQALTPAPYALFAPSAGTAAMASNVVLGAVCAPNLGTPVNPLPGQVLAYDGTSLTWTNPAAGSGTWLLGGNNSTSPGENFLGTTDEQPLELKVNGQRALRLEFGSGAPNLIGGSSQNSVGPRLTGATVCGGASNSIAHGGPPFSVIGGGAGNLIEWDWGGPFAPQADTIAGGNGNKIGYGTVGTYGCNTIGGGGGNGILGYDDPRGDVTGGTIAGGMHNHITFSSGSSVAGGSGNWIDCFFDSAIGGGRTNRIGNYNATLFSELGTISGGAFNFVVQRGGTIGGGEGNYIGPMPISPPSYRAGPGESTISGGMSNRVYGTCGTIPGGFDNFATNYAFAAGYRAQAMHSGAFVWAAGNTTDYPSSGTNTFNLYAPGGCLIHYGGQASDGRGLKYVVLASTTPGRVINVYNGAYLSETGVWTDNSDRNAKQNFAAVDGQEVLARVAELPISSWSYKSDDSVRHIGPVAQDFYDTFRVGQDDTHIAPLDSAGVALAAIQGLNQVVREKDAEIKELKSRLERLERLLDVKNGEGQ